MKRKRNEAVPAGRRYPQRRRMYYRPRKPFFPRPVYTRSSSVKRPALQISGLVYGNSSTGAVKINTGALSLVTAFKAGTAEECRHSNQTIVKSFDISGTLYVQSPTSSNCGPVVVYFWLIYDSEPRQAIPNITDVFSMPWTSVPSSWRISRSSSHRFVVKRKWHYELMSDGVLPQSNTKVQTHNPVSRNMMDFSKYINNLGVPTEWMSTGDGTIGDIKKGALYLAAACRQGIVGDATKITIEVEFIGQSRTYFKSIGYQ
ncbi:coat protein [Eragrostis curvula streak virus]|uniref:Capsid protein n=1 Tax=Eragrostis curvula streak virus TaxID=638358 RepID=C3UV62_9GEMI|nr:coat protein [Eragrostis curvula streak virus]ACO88019.1 coat protein [Eragrostis curvula streak virus]ACO88022.1 coat protein [Eragrostis curvula streak virus]ACO88026.1 coat protein [Eragrostis curvula streak virus]ACO88028.1 coat protein [Eragrostis curvula streak virus]